MGLLDRWRKKRTAQALRRKLANHAYERSRIEKRREESRGRPEAGGGVLTGESGRDEVIDLPGGPIRLGPATNLLRFPAGWEQRYESHLALVAHLKERGAYPALEVVGLKQASPHASCARIVLVTGPASEAGKLPDAFFTPEAEERVVREHGNDWTAVNPASSVANLSDPGSRVDPAPYNALLDELRAGFYRVDRKL